jgi:hypothetical protein
LGVVEQELKGNVLLPPAEQVLLPSSTWKSFARKGSLVIIGSFLQASLERHLSDGIDVFPGGGTDLVISRKYSGMKLANLAAVGDALREMKII